MSDRETVVVEPDYMTARIVHHTDDVTVGVR